MFIYEPGTVPEVLSLLFTLPKMPGSQYYYYLQVTDEKTKAHGV